MKVIRVILFIINLILSIGLIASSLAGQIAPSQAMWVSLAAFAYLPLVVANIAMVVVWLLLRRWTVLLPVAALALRIGMVPAHVQLLGTPNPPANIEAHPHLTRLLSYNVHQFHGPDIEPCSASEATAYAQEFLRIVRESEADVLCLQEYASVRGVDITDSLLLMGYNHYYGAHENRKGTPYGTVVFSRWPFDYVKRIDQEKVLVEVMRDSLAFRLLAVHLSSYRFDQTDFALRDKSLSSEEYKATARRTLAKVRETLANHEREWAEQLRPAVEEQRTPIVVAGDFNDIPSSYIYHQLTRHLADSFRAHGRGLGITYGGGFPYYRIDWVMLSPQLRACSHSRLRSDVSDHYPVLVSFEPQ